MIPNTPESFGERLDVPHPIRGVANEQVQAKWKVKVPIGLPGGGLTYYQCLYLEKNSTPGLLGMNAMKKAYMTNMRLVIMSSDPN